MSSAALAREISEIVTRSLSGEEIDPDAQGKALAARYPQLGMSGELIGKAIARTAGMMQSMRTVPAAANGADAPKPNPVAAAAQPETGQGTAFAGDPEPEDVTEIAARFAPGNGTHPMANGNSPGTPLPAGRDNQKSSAEKSSEGRRSIFRRALSRN